MAKKTTTRKVPAKKSNAKKTAAKKPAARVEPSPCLCGCGGQTASRFMPGHDARVKGWGIRIAKDAVREGEPKRSDLTKGQLAYLLERGIL